MEGMYFYQQITEINEVINRKLQKMEEEEIQQLKMEKEEEVRRMSMEKKQSQDNVNDKFLNIKSELIQVKTKDEEDFNKYNLFMEQQKQLEEWCEMKCSEIICPFLQSINSSIH